MKGSKYFILIVPKVCGFVGFGKVMEKVEGIRRLGLAGSLKAEFLKTAAEYLGDLDADE